ncbi:MAG: hypothetical protein ABJP79_00665 [Tateyamaria sp.]|uniref:hypothetical protein n=1 Tax=Tateyamaria sp. TaxID=1929288 RepID=UPI00329AB0AF
MDESKYRVFLFGGARGIGNWFARKILAKHLDEYEVHICDVAMPKTMAPRSDFYWRTISYKEGFIEGFPEDLSDKDIIILSVPISTLPELLEHLSKHISGRPQVVNFCSVQHDTNSEIKEALSDKCVAYGLHLLFGPGVSHPAGNGGVVTDLASHMRTEHVSRFLEVVASSGLYLEYSSSEKHDDMMQILQVGVHFTFFGFAKYLADHKVDFSELLKYRTLPAGFFLSFMARALSQPKLTYANIQLQDGADEARSRISRSLIDLASEIEQSPSPANAEQTLKQISDYFKREDLQEGVAATFAAVQAHELASRQIHDSVGEQELVGISLPVKDRDEVEVRVGYIQKEERGVVIFDDRLRSISDASEGYSFALLSNEASIEYAKRNFGLAFTQRPYPLSKKRFRFLNSEYLKQWIDDNVVRARLSFPVRFVRFDVDLVGRIEQLVPLMLPYVEHLNFGKLYIQDDRQVSAVCFASFEASVSPEKAKEEILGRVVGLIEAQ